MKTIGLVLPVYNEAGNIHRLHERLSATLSKLSDFNPKFIYVNDGSSDESLTILKELKAEDSRIMVLDLARNYGHQVAVTAGIDAADEDVVVIMDTDLQDPPELIEELVERWRGGADVVYAQRRSRKDGPLKKLTAKIYYRTLSKLSAIDIPEDTGDYRLLDRTVVNELKRYREHNRYIRGMVSNIGFKQEAVLFDRDARDSGKSGYSWGSMIKLAMDGIFSFSVVPLRIVSYAGALLALTSIVIAAFYFIAKIITPEMSVAGWTYIVVGMFFLGGIQLIMLGVIGNYIGRAYVETQGRPLYSLQPLDRSGRELDQ